MRWLLGLSTVVNEARSNLGCSAYSAAVGVWADTIHAARLRQLSNGRFERLSVCSVPRDWAPARGWHFKSSRPSEPLVFCIASSPEQRSPRVVHCSLTDANGPHSLHRAVYGPDRPRCSDDIGDVK